MDNQGAVHYSQLPPAEPGSKIAEEWETYRREVGRLLAEGHEGRFAVIKADRVVGLFNTCDEARAMGARRFLLEPYLIQQVRRHEPLHHHARYGPCPT